MTMGRAGPSPTGSTPLRHRQTISSRDFDQWYWRPHSRHHGSLLLRPRDRRPVLLRHHPSAIPPPASTSSSPPPDRVAPQGSSHSLVDILIPSPCLQFRCKIFSKASASVANSVRMKAPRPPVAHMHRKAQSKKKGARGGLASSK